MELIYHIKTEVNAVFLLNGSFVESAEKVIYRDSEPLYITVLPLEALYLPYTVKLTDGKAITNESLTDSFSLGKGHFYVILKARYNYVYSPERQSEPIVESGIVPKFFKNIRDKRFGLARECLTHELSASVDDGALTEFFADYVAAIENVYTPAKGWFLLKKEGDASVCDIKIRSGLIDNFEIN